MRGLPIKYYRHVIEQTGAVIDKPSTFIFKRLREAVELRIMAIEGAERIDTLPEEDAPAASMGAGAGFVIGNGATGFNG